MDRELNSLKNSVIEGDIFYGKGFVFKGFFDEYIMLNFIIVNWYFFYFGVLL